MNLWRSDVQTNLSLGIPQGDAWLVQECDTHKELQKLVVIGLVGFEILIFEAVGF